MSTSDDTTRIPALDGLRGLMAGIVLIHHFSVGLGYVGFASAAHYSVCGFFTLSGYVLTRSWDGEFAVFLLRRFIRLWPVYAICLALGYALAGVPVVASQFFWWPLLTPNSLPKIDPPVWSLGVEAWAMVFMPLIVRAKGNPILAGALIVVSVAASRLDAHLWFGQFFAIGAFLSRWSWRNRFLESAIPQWLGRVSYSLYLSHWLVFEAAGRAFGPSGLIASLPVAFAIAWALWRWVELPGIRFSRRVAKLAKRDRRDSGALVESA